MGTLIFDVPLWIVNKQNFKLKTKVSCRFYFWFAQFYAAFNFWCADFDPVSLVVTCSDCVHAWRQKTFPASLIVRAFNNSFYFNLQQEKV